MTPKFLLELAFVLGFGGTCIYLAARYTDAVRAEERLAKEAAEARLKAVEETLADVQEQQRVLSVEVVRRGEFDRAIRDARATTTKNLDKVTHEDPVARDYLSEPLPDSVREAIRGNP